MPILETFMDANELALHNTQMLEDYGPIIMRALADSSHTEVVLPHSRSYYVNTQIVFPRGAHLRGEEYLGKSVGESPAKLILGEMFNNQRVLGTHESTDGVGILIKGIDGVRISNLHITRNPFGGKTRLPKHEIFHVIAISALNSQNLTLDHLEIYGFTAAAPGLITINDCLNVSVHHNLLYNCEQSRWPIYVPAGSTGNIGQITGVSIDGEAPRKSTTGEFFRNLIMGIKNFSNQTDGFLVNGGQYGARKRIRDNVVIGMDEGMDVHGSNATFERNLLLDCKTGFKVMHGASKNIFRKNSLTNCKCYGFAVLGSTPNAAEFNTHNNEFYQNTIEGIGKDCDEKDQNFAPAGFRIGLPVTNVCAPTENIFDGNFVANVTNEAYAIYCNGGEFNQVLNTDYYGNTPNDLAENATPANSNNRIDMPRVKSS